MYGYATEQIFGVVEKTKVVTLWGARCRFTVTAKLYSLAGQSPYFSLTGWYRELNSRDQPRAGGAEGGGQCHDLIREHFPDLAEYIKWHLCAVHSGPMHYVANGVYWLKENNRPYFASTTVLGEVAGDENFWPTYDRIGQEDQLRCLPDDGESFGEDYRPYDPQARLAYAQAFLEQRLPVLRDQFQQAMRLLLGEKAVARALEFQPTK